MVIDVPGVDEFGSDLSADMAWLSKRPGWTYANHKATNGRLEFGRSLGVWSLSVTNNGVHFREVAQNPTRLHVALFEIIFPVNDAVPS